MKWYVVFKGHNLGVYNSWAACNDQVSGFRGNLYQGYKTKEEAECAFEKYIHHQKHADLITKAIEEATSSCEPRAIPGNVDIKDYIIWFLVIVVIIQFVIICT